MVPNFHNGEYLLTDKITSNRSLPFYRKPERGDVIVFRAPMNESYDFIKRVIAVAGDTVMVMNNRVYINGKLLDESKYLDPTYISSPGHFLSEGVSFTVPDGTVIAFGDNRSHSSDSREWGPVPLENIVGRAFYRYWPVNEVGLIRNPNNGRIG